MATMKGPLGLWPFPVLNAIQQRSGSAASYGQGMLGQGFKGFGILDKLRSGR